MQLDVTQATRADLETVWGKRSEITRLEFHGTDPLGLAAIVDRQNGHTCVLHCDGEPVTIIGHIESEYQGVRLFWFLCTEKYWTLGVPGVRVTRSHLATIKAKWPYCSFQSWSLSTRPDVGRWFRAIGFDPGGRVAEHQVFVLKR